ncbi:MAG TPA: hypothetical protein VK655_07005 [Solirubrobacteraceae bacterium]|nr:hypothetical protein [Solirubrobacteraceae bacterium]
MPVDVVVEDDRHEWRLGGIALQVVAVGGDVVSVGAPSSAPAAAGGLALKAGEDALHDQRALELGEHAEHLHHHPPRRGARVEWLGRGAEGHAGLVKLIDYLCEPTNRARETIDAVDEQHIEASPLGVAQQARECRPVDHGPGELVLIAQVDLPLGLT